MPRPSKRVSPDTLGGRIRAARQNLHLSLAEVAGNRYSTSLISQIERNRVDPSQESLHYLAERLKLPLEDLLALAQQHRESEGEVSRYKIYEEQRVQAQQALMGNRPREALELLHSVDYTQVPASLRWRLAALRGQSAFALRAFREAQQHFQYASAERPAIVSSEQAPEAMLLALHQAAASRELGQIEAAAQQYGVALKMMNTSTPLRYVAEAHWGMAMIAFEQAQTQAEEAGSAHITGPQAQEALQHARSASTLYQAIGDQLDAAALSCEIGLIEQASGNLEGARTTLLQVLHTWQPLLAEQEAQTPAGRRHKQERANVVSAAACYLAEVELEAHHYEAALDAVGQAEEAAEQSYILRRAEASMVRGKILEAQYLEHPECDGAAAEEAFRKAVTALEQTDRIAARIKALDLLGRHLLKKGKISEGERELNRARRLSQYIPPFGSTLSPHNESALAEA